MPTRAVCAGEQPRRTFFVVSVRDLMKRLALCQGLLLLSVLRFAGFFAFQISIQRIGDRLDAQGLLREPLALIPTSVVLLMGRCASLA